MPSFLVSSSVLFVLFVALVLVSQPVQSLYCSL